MPEREIVITEADLQRLLQAFRRGLQPLTLDELVAILRKRDSPRAEIAGCGADFVLPFCSTRSSSESANA